MTSKADPKHDALPEDSPPQLETANPADALPSRTTPTWEIEVLLSGASAFAMFQIYDGLQRSLFDLFERVSPQSLGMWATLGAYVQAGVLALALGFVLHLLTRAFWAAAVGLHSIDPQGDLGRTAMLGPLQRALVAARLAKLPTRIAELDDWATIIFGVSLGLAKLMAGLVVMALVCALLGMLVEMASNGGVRAHAVMMGLLVAIVLPMLIATAVDNQRGKAGRPTPAWAKWMLQPYIALGMTADNNLALQMMIHRVSAGKRSQKGNVAAFLLVTVLMVVVVGVPAVQRIGVGAMMKGEFPRLATGQAAALRPQHYLDRLPVGQALKAPALPSEIARGPLLRLFVPYVPDWHDALLAGCRETVAGDGDGDWRLEDAMSATVLACVAAAMPVTVNGLPVSSPWLFAEDRRADRRGFVVMIDVRSLPAGRHEVQVKQPEAALEEDEPVVPWRIPFWR